MSSPSPGINERVEITVKRGGTYLSRVEDLNGALISLAAPLDLLVTDAPVAGMDLSIRWIAGERGRYSADAVIARVDHGHVSIWVIEITGTPVIEQNREYVRSTGGGGVDLTIGADKHHGEIIDISERGLRAQFKRLEIAEGTEATLRVRFDDEPMDLTGTLFKRYEQAVPSGVQLVFTLDTDERQAQAIRKHVMNQQRLARARARDRADAG